MTYTVVIRDVWDVELDRITRDSEQAAYDAAWDAWDGNGYSVRYELETK